MNAAGRTAGAMRGLLALATLVALIVGLPVLLYRLGGSPVPSRLPSLKHVEFVLLRQDNGSLFLGAVRDVSWLAWAAFAIATVTEAQAALRRRRAPRLHLPGMQAAASRLVASVALMFSAPATAALAVAPAMAASVRTAVPLKPPEPQRDASATVDAERVIAMDRMVTVHPGDCLWTIAQRYLGSGERYHEIVRLNFGRYMGDGRVFDDPALILPGWRLLMPGASVASQPLGAGSGGAVDPAASHHPGHSSGDPRYRHPHPAAHYAGGGQATPAASPGGIDAAPGPQDARPALAPAGAHDEWRALGLFALGMLAGGVLTSLERLRHQQRQRRRSGRRIPLPEDEDGWQVERKLRAAAGLGGPAARLGDAAVRLGQFARGGEEEEDDGWPPDEDEDPDLPATLGAALRALAAGVASSGLPLPPIVGVHLTGDSLDVLLSAPAGAPPPPPFTIAPARQAMCWTVQLGRRGHVGTEEPEPGEVGDLLPGLFTAGATDGGGFLLLDLEAMRVTCCDGPDDLPDRLLVTAATELASSQWSGWYDLILVGCDDLEIVGRAGRCGDLDEALALLEARARVVEGRLRDGGPLEVRTRRLAEPEDEDWGLTLLVSRDRPTPEQMARLLDVTDGPGGIAALVAGDTQADDGKVAPALLALAPEPDRPGDMVATIHLAHLGPDRHITAWPRTLTVPEYQALAGVFATAARSDDISADAPPYADYGGPPWLRLAAAPVAVADDAPPLLRPVSRPEPGDPPEPVGYAPRHSPRGLEVRVLGPVEVTGLAEPLQSKQAELVLALALHAPVGLAGSALCELLGPDEEHPRSADWFRQLITRTRRRLGLAPDGREYVVHQGGGRYLLHESVRLDWTEFMALAGRGRADRNAADLHAALKLVRGQPFADCYHWWIDVALIETIRAEIVDTAETLASLELDVGDAIAAAAAARAGLAAEPTAEPLWRALMRAEHETGNPAGVTQAWNGCLDAIAELAPGADAHPDTERLYRHLSQLARQPSFR